MTKMKGENARVPEISPTDSLTNRFFAFNTFRNKDVEISIHSCRISSFVIKNHESFT